MNPVILIVGGVAIYMMTSKGAANANMGARPRTNVYANGKDYAMNRDNYNLGMGYVATKGIGLLGTPKQLIYDRAGVLHEHYLPSFGGSGCNCKH